MKKNAFTFIEVLGVITILAIISTLIIITVDKNLKDSKRTLSEIQIESIKSAASMWRTDNIELIPNTGYYTITLGDLIEQKYLTEDVMNIETNKKYNNNLAIKIYMNDIKIGN